MRIMREFKLDLTGTPEEREVFKRGEQSALTIPMKMPVDVVIRRINARILQHLRKGINPKTREFGDYVEAEECAYLWAECDSESIDVDVTFKAIPAGFEIPNHPYVGTFLLQAGAIVFHVYGPI